MKADEDVIVVIKLRSKYSALFVLFLFDVFNEPVGRGRAKCETGHRQE